MAVLPIRTPKHLCVRIQWIDTRRSLRGTYNVFDMYAAICKKTLDERLADRDVMDALGGLVVPPTG